VRLLYIGHANALKDDLTGRGKTWAWPARWPGLVADDRQIGEALRMLGLAGARTCPPACCLRGSRRRVALARLALGADTPLWVLDEPFTALDAAAIDCVQSLIGGTFRAVAGSYTPALRGEHRGAVFAAHRSRGKLK